MIISKFIISDRDSHCEYSHRVPKNSDGIDDNVPLYSLTASMEQSPDWDADRFSASQEISCISWNPKVHYRSNKSLPPVTVLTRINPVRASDILLHFTGLYLYVT